MEKAERTPEFYRYHYDKVVFALSVMIFLMLVLVTVVIYQVFHRPIPKFYAETPNGQSIPLVSSDLPVLMPNTLITWATKAAVAAYTFDFVNYKKEIQIARPYFTDQGWADYQSSISDLISTITQKQLFVNSVVAGAPIISNQGEMPGVGYAWRVQMPFLVTYQTSEETVKKNFTMILTIVRIPTTENPKGIGINQLVMS